MRDVQIQTTSICNAKCLICPYVHSYLAKNKAIMVENTFRTVINRLKKSSVKIGKLVLYLQNEPFTDPDLFDRIRYVRKNLEFRYLELSTNCSLLNKEKIELLLKAIEDCPTDMWLSFQGTSESEFEEMTGLSWETCLKNIEHFLVRTDNTHISRMIMCVGRPDSVATFWNPMFLRLGLKRRPRFELSPPISRASNVQGKYAKQIKKSGKHYLGCDRLHRWVHVNWLGKLIPCCMDYENEIILGDLLKEGLDPILARITSVMESNETADFLCYRCEKA